MILGIIFIIALIVVGWWAWKTPTGEVENKINKFSKPIDYLFSKYLLSAIGGSLIGGLIGFMVRPSVPIIGQLPFNTVISRGRNYSGLDTVLISTAQSSFNYLVAGLLIGGVVGIGIHYFVVHRMPDESILNKKINEEKTENDIPEKLKKLADLKEKKIISEEEFQRKKEELLERM